MEINENKILLGKSHQTNTSFISRNYSFTDKKITNNIQESNLCEKYNNDTTMNS